MTLTSCSNHWMFISSTGGITAGKVNSNSSLFPYYTDDRVSENVSNTGPLTAILIEKDDKNTLWKPFTNYGENIYNTKSYLYKNIYGNILIFKDVNLDLNIAFSYYWMNSKKYSFANVPYKIKPFKEIVKDPYNTIIFDSNKNSQIEELTKEIGSDGKLLLNNLNNVVLSSFTEKLLIHLLTKLGNFIPEAGIWMNTQRPEWNDANNALVGKGVSVVTLSYLRRYVNFLNKIFTNDTNNYYVVSKDISI